MGLIAGNGIVTDLEKAGALGIYVPPEGGYEGRYLRRIRNCGYDTLLMSARGLGDISSYLTQVHGVRPSHLGKTDIRTYFLPPLIQTRLASLAPQAKGLALWMIEGKYLCRQELETLAQICVQQPRVKIVVEVGSDRQIKWLPLTEMATKLVA
ncbi:MAG: NAD(P)H-quinone oxidoreductase subunit N [Pseudanabaenaceae cyanobacterium bins.68]|nr:NAD(P)H-quinone oxidoreductase subunit N [Pseudanabaenaceae cyanobacterium bins.68]